MPDDTKRSALTFDGRSNYIELPALNLDYSKGFTIEAWVRFDSFAPNWSRIFDFGNGQENNNILLARAGTGRTLCLCVLPRRGNYSFYSHDILEQDVCFHLALTMEPGGRTVVYKNGAPCFEVTLDALPPNLNRTHCYIGRSN
ncbi:MAG: LamG domain-containing protein, partial [Verrucomicrobiota bacterium]